MAEQINKTLMERIQQGRQYRKMALEVREAPDENDEKIVEGYATTFDEPYTLFSFDDLEIREVVDPKAFDNCDMNDVIFQYDHTGRVFARKSNGTLNLNCDEHGLKVSANLGGTSIGRELYEEIRGGYTSKMSFGFTIDQEDETYTREGDKDVYLYTIRSIGKLYDVSAVSLPANDGTEISARSLLDGVIERRNKALEEEKSNKLVKERERLMLELSFNI